MDTCQIYLDCKQGLLLFAHTILVSDRATDIPTAKRLIINILLHYCHAISSRKRMTQGAGASQNPEPRPPIRYGVHVLYETFFNWLQMLQIIATNRMLWKILILPKNARSKIYTIMYSRVEWQHKYKGSSFWYLLFSVHIFNTYLYYHWALSKQLYTYFEVNPLHFFHLRLGFRLWVVFFCCCFIF